MQDSIGKAFVELTSVESSLNMIPEQLENPVEGARFLSETDKWAAHAVEHIHATHEELRKVEAKTHKMGADLTRVWAYVLEVPGVNRDQINFLFEQLTDNL